ncbi:TIGR01440 family protein [Pontibacillus halophilus]
MTELVDEWIDTNALSKGDLFVLGCSTSEIAGERIGTAGSEAVAEVIYTELQRLREQTGIHLAFQCCEHLNRAIVMERDDSELRRYERVSVVPVPGAGGSMASYAYHHLHHPVVVEEVQAEAGLDLGDTLIGMHLKRVAVPLRFSIKQVGHAHVTAAKTRPKLIGGNRAVYDETKVKSSNACD